jgi:TPR repeat protein
MYMEGECVPADGARAVEWFTKAAEQGLVGSQTTLAMMYEEGRGVARDPEKAREWYRKAGFGDKD